MPFKWLLRCVSKIWTSIDANTFKEIGFTTLLFFIRIQDKMYICSSNDARESWSNFSGWLHQFQWPVSDCENCSQPSVWLILQRRNAEDYGDIKLWHMQRVWSNEIPF